MHIIDKVSKKMELTSSIIIGHFYENQFINKWLYSENNQKIIVVENTELGKFYIIYLYKKVRDIKDQKEATMDVRTRLRHKSYLKHKDKDDRTFHLVDSLLYNKECDLGQLTKILFLFQKHNRENLFELNGTPNIVADVNEIIKCKWNAEFKSLIDLIRSINPHKF